MRAVEIQQYGGPEVMALQEVPEPEPGPGEVLIRVQVSSVNFHDVFLREGLFGAAFPFPVRMGLEVAGTIEAFGEGVEGDLEVGTRVAAVSPREGGYAELVVVPAQTAIPIPDRMDFEEAGALLVNYLTAHAEIFGLHESGAIKPHIDARFKLKEAAQAHRYIQDRKNRGKVLIMA